MKLLLAMDLSTVTCGYTIMDLETEEIKLISYFSMKDDEMLDKALYLKKQIDLILTTYKIDVFVIEERLRAFASKFTNIEALGKTAAINFCAQFLMKERGAEVIELHVSSARKLAFPLFHKAKKLVDLKDKEYAFDLVKKELGEDIFPKKVMKSGKDKGQTRFLEEAKDMADSYILAKAICNKEKYGNK
jgi:Holliday junction resolvasome RuvABC endonuclease subunit